MPPKHATIGLRYHAWVARRPVLVLIVAGAVAIAATGLASRLQLRTAFSELLPSDDPGVVALARTQKRIGDLNLLLIGIRSPDPEANLKYAEALTEQLRALPQNTVAMATYHIRDVRSFFEKNRWLYVSEEDLEAIRDRLRSEISRRKNPLYVSLGEDEPLEALRDRLTKRKGLDDRFPGGLFADAKREFVWIAALPPGGLFVERAGEGLWEAAHRLLNQNPPESYHPQMKAQISGPIATAIASRQAVERDILWVTLTCVVVVALSIGLYFRRVRAIPLTGLPAALGTVMAFAVAQLAFGYLNSSTAFLGSIIIGNGINYAIVLMSRYEEHRGQGADPYTALGQAIDGVWRPTSISAVAASSAYASLMVTSFRGFYQFGVMGAVGVLFCWLSTFTILPAMLTLLDRRDGERERSTARAPFNLSHLARALQGHQRLFLGVSLVLTLVSIYGAKFFLKDPFEYDFRKLNAKIRTSDDARQFDKNLDALFGRWPNPTIILADEIGEVEAIRKTIRKQDAERPGPDVIGQILTIWDLLPGTPEVQRRKLALLADIRKLTHDPALEILDEKERKQLAQVDPSPDLKVLEPGDLPPLARRPFTEVDGTVGRVVLVYPIEHGLSVWNGRDLLRLSSVLQFLHLPDGKVLETSGPAVVFGAMIRSILRDGPVATVASLVAVLIVIAFTIRPARSALMALATLIVGVLWMVGAAGLGSVRVTFLNFIALPITFGIGVEYALNVITRYHDEKEILRAVMSTGAAVALCSWTTIVGYGSLLAARNQALNGFGAMAILGEAACLATAIVALPAALLWYGSRKARRG